MKKKYVHINEYELTRNIIDILDIDVEDDSLYLNGIPLHYKSKPMALMSYKNAKDFNSNDLVAFRPFTNQNHAHYLINLFSELKNFESKFEYMDCEDEKYKGTLEGLLEISYENGKTKKIRFKGMKSVQCILGAIIVKLMFNNDDFKSNIKKIYKIDDKLTNKR